MAENSKSVEEVFNIYENNSFIIKSEKKDNKETVLSKLFIANSNINEIKNFCFENAVLFKIDDKYTLKLPKNLYCKDKNGKYKLLNKNTKLGKETIYYKSSNNEYKILDFSKAYANRPYLNKNKAINNKFKNAETKAKSLHKNANDLAGYCLSLGPFMLLAGFVLAPALFLEISSIVIKNTVKLFKRISKRRYKNKLIDCIKNNNITDNIVKNIDNLSTENNIDVTKTQNNETTNSKEVIQETQNDKTNESVNDITNKIKNYKENIIKVDNTKKSFVNKNYDKTTVDKDMTEANIKKAKINIENNL